MKALRIMLVSVLNELAKLTPEYQRLLKERDMLRCALDVAQHSQEFVPAKFTTVAKVFVVIKPTWA